MPAIKGDMYITHCNYSQPASIKLDNKNIGGHLTPLQSSPNCFLCASAVCKPGRLFQTRVSDLGLPMVNGRAPFCYWRPSVILRLIHHLQIAFYAHQCRLLHVLNTKPTISEHWTPKWRLKTVKIPTITCRQNGSLKINLFTFQHHIVVTVQRPSTTL